MILTQADSIHLRCSPHASRIRKSVRSVVAVLSNVSLELLVKNAGKTHRLFTGAEHDLLEVWRDYTRSGGPSTLQTSEMSTL